MAAAAGFDWARWGAAAWDIAKQSATAGVAFLAGLPRNCYLASAHAAMVCTDMDPQYTATPGFGPFALGWGWLVLGGLLGVLLTLSFLTLTGRIKQEPSVMHLAVLMQQFAMPVASQPAQPSVMSQQARADALRYISIAGQPALRELASAARMSDGAFLAHLTGTCMQGAVSQAPPGLTIHQ